MAEFDQPLAVRHSIIAVQRGRQGAGQTVPEDLVVCRECGWLTCSAYGLHMQDLIAEHDRQVEIAVIEKLMVSVHEMGQAFILSEVGTVVRKLDVISMLSEQAQKLRREGENDE